MSGTIEDVDINIITKGKGNLVFKNDISGWVLDFGITAVPNSYGDIYGSSVASDEKGCSYVIGGGANSSRAFVIKVNHIGEVLWCKSISEYTLGESIVYKSGVIFVLLQGNSRQKGGLVLKINTDGVLINQWFISHEEPGVMNGYDISVDENDNVYLFGDDNHKLVISKIDTVNNILDWSVRLNGEGSFETYFGKYSNGNLYIGGVNTSDGIACLAKLDTSGIIIWNKSIEVSLNTRDNAFGGDTAFSLASDIHDNIYISGRFKDMNAGGNSSFYMKLNSSGLVIWSRSTSLKQISCIEYHPTNGLFIADTGISVFDYSYDAIIAKIDESNGDIIWSKQIGSSDNDYTWYSNGHRYLSISEDKLYLTGYTYDGNQNGDTNLFLLSYDLKGVLDGVYSGWHIINYNISSIYSSTYSVSPLILRGVTYSQMFEKTSFVFADGREGGLDQSAIEFDEKISSFAPETQLIIEGEINVDDLYILPRSSGNTGDVLTYGLSGSKLEWTPMGVNVGVDSFTIGSIPEAAGDISITNFVGQTEVTKITLTNINKGDEWNIDNTKYSISDTFTIGGWADIRDNIRSYWNDSTLNVDENDVSTTIYSIYIYDDTAYFSTAVYSDIKAVVGMQIEGDLTSGWANILAIGLTSSPGGSYETPDGSTCFYIQIDQQMGYEGYQFAQFDFISSIEYTITSGSYDYERDSLVRVNILSGNTKSEVFTEQGYSKIDGFDDDFVEIKISDISVGGAAGTIDSTFTSSNGILISPNSTNTREVFTSKLQSDGKLLVGGLFDSYAGVTASNIVRVNLDGTIDSTFNTGAGFDNSVYTIEYQQDGKILVGGRFTSYKGVTASRIIRLNSDGSIDNNFNIGTGFDSEVRCIALRQDGKLVVGGYFGIYNEDGSYAHLITLNQDGSIDRSITPTSVGVIYCITMIPGTTQFLIGGEFRDYILQVDYSGNTKNIGSLGGVVRAIAYDSNHNAAIIGGDFTDHLHVIFNLIDERKAQ